MSSRPGNYIGNGKRHRTPLPGKPRKIKRVKPELFLHIKELFKNIKRPRTKKKRHYRKKPVKAHKKPVITIPEYNNTYEPSKITDTRDSLFWSWRRVAEWEQYINDPLEKIKRAPYNLL